MKDIYIVTSAAAALAVGFFVWKSGQAREAAKNKITENPITDGSNWQGTMWQRLSALDLVAQGFPNLNGGTNAAPSHAGRSQLGIVAGWDGSR